MQSCLYFSRSGRHSLQNAKRPLVSHNKLLSPPQVKGAGISRSIHEVPAKIQSTVGGRDRDTDHSPASRRSQAVDYGRPRSAFHSSGHGNSIRRYPSLPDSQNAGTFSLRYVTHGKDVLPQKREPGNSIFSVRRPIRFKKRHRPEVHSPAFVLAKYLDFRDIAEKEAYWHHVKETLPCNSLPTIVLHHLYIKSIPKDDWEDYDHTLRNSAVEYLQSRNLDITDVEQWAWILSGATSDERVERLVSVASDHPTFLLLEVLRRDINYVANWKKLLLHAWSHVEQKCLQNSSISDEIPKHEFEVLISRLLHQTRRILPAAMPSVANMVPLYVQSLRDRSSRDPHELDRRIYNRSCDIINRVLLLLALPASIDPLKSMVHNWSAQKVLLNLAGNHEPPLMLDKDSYGAVIRVLTASQKTDRESKAAILRLRTWPPWRTEQDGMDAQRTPDDDLSRALLAVVRSREAGFRETSFDKRLRILGGQELDGTPTIHTRNLVKWRRPQVPPDGSEEPIGSLGDAQVQNHASADPGVWAARVEATRDIREAWRAFVTFKGRGGKPNQALYLAMFQKLNFEQARQGRKTAYEAAPGDGREVLPVPDDNMSDFYKSHSQPPTLGALYSQMLSSGIRPSGQCLVFLVRHARNSTTGINYLRDSGLHPHALQYLTGGKDTRISPNQKPPHEISSTISDRALGAFIHLICRFAPRAVLTTSDEFSKYKLKPIQPKEGDPSPWAIQEFEKTPYYRLQDPLRQASRLLKNEKVTFRPAWYSLFKGLARRNVLLRFALVGDPKNDALAWRFTVSVLNNFHECGLELDPHGFMLICTTFFKFAEATHLASKEYEEDLASGAQLLKDEFVKLSKSEAVPYCTTTLFHPVRWVTLHIYVRCMGIVEDRDEIIATLEWMVRHHEELEECNSQDRNSQRMLTRTLVAARISCYRTEHEGRAMDLVKQVPTWKWPDDSDVELYIGGLEAASDEDED